MALAMPVSISLATWSDIAGSAAAVAVVGTPLAGLVGVVSVGTDWGTRYLPRCAGRLFALADVRVAACARPLLFFGFGMVNFVV